MKRSELFSRILITAGILLAVGTPLFFSARTPLIHARMADTGGWTPDVIQAEVGKPLHLQFTSDDVMQGFAVGQMDMEAVTIEPGKVTDVTLNFDKPGTYTFFCTRWCDVNHWRMRGTIEVSGPAADGEPAPIIPLYVTLGIDIDAPHEADAIPANRPSAVRGQQLAASLDISKLSNPDFYHSNSPYQVFEALESTGLSTSDKWDLVAYIWQSKSMNGSMDMAMQTPAVFTEAKRMLGASPALLEGKILRGGMGTGMPMWGSIFTQNQIRDLVAYIYSFQFEYQK